ncbi:alpha/beta hydrolase [Heyndrickxia shackletonii]|uniref:Alpha/beta hydrolase n=1 Tax=Heyndrickxia shackletonii TaxID=157838 RepID=A0A0Q3WXA8_9BACI|nr:alpha/beta hydrolase [Heyndrickxia shackletonii]KQL53549.1 alpha/beta hydrolase [Heyndrickxia shackletonii]NEY99632.1 alpha/beta fold hydrolase [Heyndrickxia shackletonii]
MILHTKILGEGEAILFLHTGLQTGETDFQYQAEFFSKHYKIVLPDLRGHGKSTCSKIDNFFYDSVEDLYETIDFLNIQKCHIVGCSLGAIVGLMFTKKYPNRVYTLSISGVIPLKPDNWEELQKADIEQQDQLLNDNNARAYYDALHENNNWTKFLSLAKKEDWYPFHETGKVENLRIPVLYIVGEEKDHEVCGVGTYKKMISDIHIAVVPFASHLVHDAQPEVYTNILDLFLQNNKIV